MAKGFNLTAQINLRGPTNLKPIVADIRRQLGSISSDVNVKLSPQSAKSISTVTSRLKSMNDILISANNNTKALSNSLSSLSSSLSGIGNVGSKSAGAIAKTGVSAKTAAQNIKQATTEMEQFGKQSALAIRRFAAFSIVSGAIYKLVTAINSGFSAFVNFDKQLIKLQQVTGKGAIGLKNLENQITNLATSLGVSSESLIEVASTLAQAGLNAEDTRIALSALAKTELAPSFDNLTDTTEGAIAALRQFELQAGDLESALGSINAVAAAFAVESRDIITAIQRTGGVFAAASKGVSEGKDALNEFIAVFTSVRATTRESAETIATGLRTIFTRIQRGKTIEALKEYGIILTDLEGKFVGPYEAVKRLSEGLKLLDPRDLRFSQIVEELGGFRQIGKVIPLIQQFAEAQKALKVAQTGQTSLTDAQLIAQKSLANQIAKVREQFLALIRDVGKSATFQAITKIVLGLTSAFISLAGAFKPILPFLAILGTIKGIKALGEFGTGFFGGLKSGTGSTAKNVGSNIGSTISGGKEKEKAAATKLAADAIRANTDALKTLTSAVQNLDSTIRSKGSTTLASGGKVLGFNSGGIVPGSGKGDKVPALLEPGEVIINNAAANKYGRGNLVRMNKYAGGGGIFKKQIPGALKGMKNAKPIGYDDISKLKINDSGKGSIRGYFFENFINKEFGVNAPENKFPDIPNLNVRKGLKERLGLTKSQTGRDFKAAELKYRSGIMPDFDSQYTPENTAVLYAINKNIGGKIQQFMAGSPGGIRVASGKGRGKLGPKGARSKFKELTPEEIAQLSTKDLISYGKALAKDIFTTGGAGMAIGNEFIEVPPERIVPELESSLVTYMGKKGFWREKIAPFGKPVATPKPKVVGDRTAALASQVTRYEDEVAAREQNWTAIKSGSDIDNYLLSQLQDPILSDYKTVRSGGSLAKPFHNTRLRQAVNKVLEEYDDFDYSSPNLNKLISGMAAKTFAYGGIVQKFMAGGIAESILGRVPTLDELSGGPFAANKVFAAGEKSWIQILEEVLSSKGIPFDKTKKTLQLSTPSGITTLSLKDAISPQKLKAKKFADSIGLDNITKLEDLRESILARYVSARSGIVLAAAPRTPDQVSAAQSQGLLFNAVGMLGKEYKNMPLQISKGLVSPIETVVSGYKLDENIAKQIDQDLSKDLNKSSRKSAKKIMIAQIIKDLTGGNSLVLDFDKTLAIGADKIIKDPKGPRFSEFGDRDKVQKALNSSRLTKLGSSLAGLIQQSAPDIRSQLLDRMSVLSARPQNTLDLIQAWLSSKGLPINKFTGVGNPNVTEDDIAKLKASLIPAGASFVDDDARNVAEATKKGIKTYRYNLGKKQESSDIAGAKGIQFQDMLEYLGAPKRNSNKKSIDFPFGLGAAAKYFNNMPSNVPTDAKRTISSASDLTDNITNYLIGTGVAQKVPKVKKLKKSIGGLIQQFAFGGKAEDSGLEKAKKQIMDKYPEIDFRISKRKSGFGYMIQGGLSADKRSQVNFASNLTDLLTVSDKMAQDILSNYGPNIDPSLLKKLQKKKFAVGGKANESPFDEFSYGSTEGGLSSLISGLYGAPGSIVRQYQGAGMTQGFSNDQIRGAPGGLAKSYEPKKEKKYGKIGLRNNGSEITATYFQNNDRSGFVNAKKAGGNLYTISLSKATKGYGPKLYDIVMEAATANGGMLTSDRNQVSNDARAVWAYYFSNRGDVKKTPLDPSQWTKNQSLIDPKLYGKKETWPPSTDPAWILQSGYSKSPSLINDTNSVVIMDKPETKLARGGSLTNSVPAMVSNGEAYVPPQLAKKIGYSKLNKMNQADRNGITGFAGGGIGVFKGAGNGTSDSIGPIGLPEGSFVIRAKATKALGLNKGGNVGLHKFKTGTPGGVPSSATEGVDTKIVSNFEAVADAMGISLYELAQTIQKTSAEARDAALAQGKSMQDAAKAAEEAASALLGLDQTVSPGENPIEGKSYGSEEQKGKMARQAIKASGTVITNIETRRAARQKDLAPEGVAVSAPGDAAAKAASRGFSRKDLISNMAGNTGSGTEAVINTYNEITKKITEAEARVKSLSDQQIDIRNAGGDSSKIDSELASAQAEAESLRSTRVSKAATAGVGQGIESDVGLNIVEYIQNFERLNEAINNGAAKVAEAKKQEEQSYKDEAAAKNKAIQERMKSIEGGSLEDRYALAKEAVESGDYDRTSESGQALDKAKEKRQQAAKDRYSAEQDLENKTKEKTRLYGRSTNIEDSLESSRRLSGNGDPFYEAKKAADAYAAEGPGGPGGPEDPGAKQRREQKFADQEFFRYKAAQTGTSEAGVKLDLAQRLGRATYESKELFGGKVSEAKTGLVARREEAMKAKDAKTKATEQANAARKILATGSGATDEQKEKAKSELEAADLQLAEANRRLQAETEAVLQQMIELRPDLAGTEDGMKKLRAASEEVANDLESGNLAAAQEKMGAAVAGTGEGGGLSAEEAAAVARTRVAKETGVDSGLLQREFGAGGASAKMAQQQAFIQSREGQRFGRLAEFAPGLAQKLSGFGGEGLGKAADFISGKGGKFSKGFAALGGFQGIGSGLAVGAEGLKNSGLISKQTLKDPNVAGAFGAVQGAGVMGATGAELGNQIAGPAGALVGAIGGAVIGGIKGFFDAKNAQILSNALDKLTKSSEGVDIAFKELAKNDTDKNFKNVQKAFGQQIEASKELDAIAFGGGEGPSVMGVGGGALVGAAGGAAIGSLVPVIGTAVGAAVGAVIGGGLAYLSEGQNKANREEALRNRAGAAAGMNESAARMAERQMGRMTTEQLGQQEKTGVNVIAEQYKQSAIAAAEAANGTKNLTAAQKEQISQGATETAYLDAYMKMRKEAGATDEKISEDIMADRKLALEAGKKALDSQSQAAMKQALLARATKEVALATENLLDVYRRVGAKAQRFSDEVDDMLGGTQATIASLGGNASVQKVDRSGSERILGNMAAYSSQEVKAATQEMVGKLGGGEEAQKLGKQAEAAKFLQDKLPAMLRQKGADPAKIMEDLRDEMKNMGIGGDAVNKMLEEVQKQISANEEGGLGTLADEISSGGIDKFSATATEAAKTLQNLSKTYNDTLQKSIDLQNQYNEVIMQSNAYLRKAGTIRINAELDLAKALGNSPTLAQLNEPFDFEIKDLTKGLVAGGTTDPTEIANGIIAATAQNQQLQEANVNIGNEGMQGAIGDTGSQLLSEQQANIAAIGANNVAINEGRQALEKLANDGTKAANALAKIEEQQRQIEGLGNRFEKIFTASPEELFKMNRQSDALALAQTAGAEQFKSRAFRQDAFAGLEQDKEFLSPEEYRKQRAMLMRKSLESQGLTGQSMIEKGGVSMTVDDFIKRIEGGVSEEDPNVKAYREAVATQIKANEELARLEELKALEIQDAMLGLQEFLANEFPKILTDAVTEAKTDAETKPETKSEPSKGEKAKAEAESQKADAQKQREDLDKKIESKKLEVSKAEANVGWQQGASTEVAIKKRELAELQAQRDTQAQAEQAATTKSKEADVVLAEEKKAKDQAKATQAAEEKKAKEAKASSSIEQSQRARAGVAPTVTPAPPAPGSTVANIQKQRADIQRKRTEKEKEKPSSSPQPMQQAQTSAVTYGSTRTIPAGGLIASGLKTEEELSTRKAQLEKELATRENTLKSAKIAAGRAGTLKTSPKVKEAEEALQNTRLALEGVTQELPQELPQQIPPGGMVSAVTPGAEERRPANPNVLRTTQQPVPSNIPKPAEYSRQVQATETGTTTQTSAKTTETAAQLLTLDKTSLEGLSVFNTTFGSYVDKLVNFQFPTIPEKIEMTGNHVVDVRVSGAAAFEALEKNIQGLINKEIDAKMGQIWSQTGGQIGTRPGTPPPKSK